MKCEILDIQFRSATFYRKNLDHPQDHVEMIGDIPVKVFDLEAFGGSVYYYRKTFARHNIVNFDTNSFVFGNSAAFMDVAFMHHSLQPGE